MTSVRVPLEGAYNFRDLGGIEAAGAARIRPGLVFRSDRLTNLTPTDEARLELLRIGRVFDLRSDLELAHDGPGAFSSRLERHRHVPLVKVSLSLGDSRIDWTKVDLQNRYLDMLEEGAPVVREVVEYLASSHAQPAVIHCTGGKDRTGVVTAVLLRVLGVADSVVIEDYAMSERYLQPFVEATRALMEREGYDPEIVLYLCGSPAERMEKMIADMDARWGSVSGYLDEIGAGEATRAALRLRLLQNS
ncbi:MAG TPA: tyrosine-protein phosphatase [Candidatus Binatia bacterium]|jgi:protein tyrosine/serine phosphatase